VPASLDLSIPRRMLPDCEDEGTTFLRSIRACYSTLWWNFSEGLNLYMDVRWHENWQELYRIILKNSFIVISSFESHMDCHGIRRICYLDISIRICWIKLLSKLSTCWKSWNCCELKLHGFWTCIALRKFFKKLFTKTYT
jgi:hypothetical protein